MYEDVMVGSYSPSVLAMCGYTSDAKFLSKVGGHKWVCAPPPPLLGRANVLISLFAHILWLKTQFF